MRRAKHSPAAKPATAKSVPAGVKKSPLAAVAMAQPSQEEIARLAYSFWLERGGAHGSAEEDWLRAERQIAARYFSAA